jgi:hypothetical protein
MTLAANRMSMQIASGLRSVPPGSSAIVQYHALGLLYLIRQGDRMAVTKMIQQLSGLPYDGALFWTASEASFAHRLITSRATGWRWYDETRAARPVPRARLAVPHPSGRSHGRHQDDPAAVGIEGLRGYTR